MIIPLQFALIGRPEAYKEYQTAAFSLCLRCNDEICVMYLQSAYWDRHDRCGYFLRDSELARHLARRNNSSCRVGIDVELRRFWFVTR